MSRSHNTDHEECDQKGKEDQGLGLLASPNNMVLVEPSNVGEKLSHARLFLALLANVRPQKFDRSWRHPHYLSSLAVLGKIDEL